MKNERARTLFFLQRERAGLAHTNFSTRQKRPPTVTDTFPSCPHEMRRPSEYHAVCACPSPHHCKRRRAHDLLADASSVGGE